MQLRLNFSILVLAVLLSACEDSAAFRQKGDGYLLQSNPALAAYQARRPSGMDAVLSRIDALRALPIDPNIKLPEKDRTLAPDSARIKLIRILKANPILTEIYKKDQKATVKLIKIIQN